MLPEFVGDTHELGTDWPASTQMYSHARPPASATSAVSTSAAGGKPIDPVSAINTSGATPPSPSAPHQNNLLYAPFTIARTASSWFSVALGVKRFSDTRMSKCSDVAKPSVHASRRIASGDAV